MVFVLAVLGASPSALGQYKGARDYMKRIEPLVPPRQTPATPAPARPGQPIQPSQVSPTPSTTPAIERVTPPLTPEQAEFQKQERLKRDVEFQQKRAEGGSAMAQYDLGMRYLTGDGVEKDAETGRKWIEASAKQRHSKALRKLEELKKEDEQRKQDAEKSR